MSSGNRAPGEAPPLFMFGFERSGTTLLSMMAGAHPEIAVPLTATGLWYVYAEKLARYDQLTTRASLERLVDDLLREERIGLWDVELERDEVLDGLQPGSFGAVVGKFHALYARKKNKPRWGSLDIATLDSMDVANGWFSDARFLHIVRDGRDVALSHQTMPYGSGNTLETAEKWVHRLQVNLKMGAILGEDRYRVIRYEDLILDTEKTLRDMCEFFGVSYSPQMLDYPEMVDDKVPDHRRWLWPALGGPPDSSKVYQWKRKMSRTKRIVFEGVARDMLRRHRYEAYERVPKSVAAFGYELWCSVTRGGRVRRLLSKLGWKRKSQLEREWRQSSAKSHEDVQKQSFGSLVTTGVYDTSFEHGSSMKAFFGSCLAYARDQVDDDDGVSVLDCGCGPGAWLAFANDEMQAIGRFSFYGFDLTPEMVDVARRRLAGRVPPEHLVTGDVLDDDAYKFGIEDRRFDIIYAFDVVQQLPRAQQREACDAMLARLAPNGCALIFDHEHHSKYGYKMAFRKFVTKHLGIQLVPRYYCNARYPELERLATELTATGKYLADVRVQPDGRKRALVVNGLGR